MSDAPDEQRKPPARGADDAPDNVLDGLFGSVPPVAPGTGSMPVTPVTDDPVANLFGSSDALPAPPIDDLPSEHELTRWSVTQGSSLFDEKVHDPAPAPAAPAPAPQAKAPAQPPAPPTLKKPRMFETQLGVPPPPPAAGSVAAPLPKAPPEATPRQVAPAPPSAVAERAAAMPSPRELALDSTMLALPAPDLGRPPGGEPPDLALASEPAPEPLPVRARAKPEPVPEPEAPPLPTEPRHLRFKSDPDGPVSEEAARGLRFKDQEATSEDGPQPRGKLAQKKGARRRSPPAKPAGNAPAAPSASPERSSGLKRLLPLAAAVVVLGAFLAGVMSRRRAPDVEPAAAPTPAAVAAAPAAPTAALTPAPVVAAPAPPAAAPTPAPVAAAPAAPAAAPTPAPVAAAPAVPAAPVAPAPARAAPAPTPAAVVAAPAAPAAAPPEPAGDAARGGSDAQTLAAAQKKLAEDDPRGALPLLEALLAKDPRDHHAAEAMAETMLALERPADAVRYAREIVKRRPKRASYRLLLGDALLMAGDKPGAEAEWRQALATDPENAQAKRRLGQ